VAPTVIHAVLAEKFLTGQMLDEETLEQTARLAMDAARPIADIRSAADYRA
jgi:CO/xanthine dehydrogenase FAD-binding subunit